MNAQAARVKRYYEANTRWMLSRGSGRGEQVIHRPVWLPGVRRRRQAVRSVDGLIRDTLEEHSPRLRGNGQRALRVLDLGCGAGGTAVWLAERLPVEVTGLTLSPAQVERARELAREHGTAERCRFVEGDFLEAKGPASLQEGSPGARFDAAYAIEAFSHAAHPATFFERAAARLAEDGVLFLCDDFSAEPADPPERGLRRSVRRQRALEAFRQGWQLGPLPGEEDARVMARAQGLELVGRTDLTPYLRARSARAAVTRGLLGLLPFSGPWISSRRGGAALQVCLRRGWVRYLYLVFRKRQAEAAGDPGAEDPAT
ncbi:MAG: methyltransferase domain-containing protein [Spirochaetales bacterium]|nr:methyltransferase domain-containing protein [Spirochaetales bacterium]